MKVLNSYRSGSVMDEKRPQSAEKLNEYIRIGSPGIVALVAALAVVLIAVLYWGFTGKLHETTSFTGIVDITQSGDVLIFVNADEFEGTQLTGKQASVKMGDRSKSDGYVSSSSASAFTEDEIAGKYDFSFWEMNNLVSGVYSYVVEIDAERDLSDYQGQLAEVSVIMNEVSPISFLMR